MLLCFLLFHFQSSSFNCMQLTVCLLLVVSGLCSDEHCLSHLHAVCCHAAVINYLNKQTKCGWEHGHDCHLGRDSSKHELSVNAVTRGFAHADAHACQRPPILLDCMPPTAHGAVSPTAVVMHTLKCFCWHTSMTAYSVSDVMMLRIDNMMTDIIFASNNQIYLQNDFNIPK